MKFGTPYDHAQHKGLDFTKVKSATMQEFKYETDINNIVDINLRYKDPAFVTKLQLAGKMSNQSPIFGDFTKVKDYQFALNTVINANEQFAMLPAKLRDKFHNNPAEMLSFVGDIKNVDECVELGIFDRTLVEQDKRQKESVFRTLVEQDKRQKESVSAGNNSFINVENTGADTVSGSAPETSA